MTETFEKFSFEIGDVVRESELIAWSTDGLLIGLIINIKRGHYFGYTMYGENFPAIDRVTILWLKEGFVESLPSDLVLLVTRDPYYQKNKS